MGPNLILKKKKTQNVRKEVKMHNGDSSYLNKIKTRKSTLKEDRLSNPI